MTDQQSLVQTIIENPDDDNPRLVFADWLEETGNPANVAHAQFIRANIKEHHEGKLNRKSASRKQSLLRGLESLY